MKFKTLQSVAYAVTFNDPEIVSHAVEQALKGEDGQGWHKALNRLVSFVREPESVNVNVWAEGNGKLPFLSFGVLPGVTCPGAGECLTFCYSFKAWRYPDAFVRQAINTWIIQNPNLRYLITDQLDYHVNRPKYKDGLTIRLYTDGDFANTGQVNYWFQVCEQYPNINFYGYSKSFNELLNMQGYYPDNYILNISSGHNHNEATVKAVEQLPITRGHFKAVSIGRKVKASEHGSQAVNKALREAYDGKAFTCAGKCGECTKTVHACGSKRFDNVDIIIAVH